MTTESRGGLFFGSSTEVRSSLGSYRSVEFSPAAPAASASISQAKISSGLLLAGQYQRLPSGAQTVVVTMDASAVPRKLAVERMNAELDGSAQFDTTAAPRKPRA
jgi:hypothetical protein